MFAFRIFDFLHVQKIDFSLFVYVKVINSNLLYIESRFARIEDALKK